jgi:hypothetical protein
MEYIDRESPDLRTPLKKEIREINFLEGCWHCLAGESPAENMYA